MPRLGNAKAPPEYPSLRQLKPRFNKFGYASSALTVALSLKPDIVLCGHLYHGPLARRLAGLTGARLVSVLHGTEIWKPLSVRHLEPLKRSDLVICVSEDTRRRLLHQLPCGPNTKVAVLNNTVEDRFQSGDRRLARARFGLDGLPTVLTVGRLDDRGGYKGHDKIIPIIARLKVRGRPTRYLIAGEGPDQPRLKKLVDDHDIADLVTFLGYVSNDALPDLYRAADVFALPSTGEGFGIVFLEAMACGTPALGLEIGGASEALGVCGKAVHESQFEEVLTAMIESPSTDHESLSAQVRAQFGRSRFEDSVASLLNEVTIRRKEEPR
jgi:phosphatidyl-myo-inositol dimannoside synthase